MTEHSLDIFEALSQDGRNTAELLDQIIEHFRDTSRPMELFEALKMRTRVQLGLPLISQDNEIRRAEDIERQLELGLLDACRETGAMLIKMGRIGEGWMYLRPTGDLTAAKEMLSAVEITDENYDDMIQVLLHEGIDIARGFQAVLDHQGTCNSITLYDQTLAGRSKQDRAAAAACLLDHFYSELCEMVRADIANREAPADPSESLMEMIEKRRWLLADGGYHLDTTHLASTVKISSVLENPEQIRKAWELTQYGRRLNHQFQYPGDEPFVDFYPAYSTYYSILLGENIDAGLTVFQRKARSVNTIEHGTAAIETYVELLDRTGRHQEAIETAVGMVPKEVPSQRLIPLLIEIARKTNGIENQDGYTALLAYCKEKQDLLGFAAVLDASRT
ncbi:hypothetical protein N9C08_00510 [Rubripirellula sp.]|jgi:hypothetical protein|nr:hypothetical protein [Rubripirellula sp.]MDA9840291.1 hypothetical protein [Rubripirellula sp.]